jgi:hypothetical protein
MFAPLRYALRLAIAATQQNVGYRTITGISGDMTTTAVYDPSATLAVHCGNGFDARFKPYQSTHLSRYNAGS